ncbi:MAG: hypothetical protein ACK4J0_02920 [Candidatus Anstonellaceae archaeon]
MGLKAQMFSLEILFASVILFLIFVLIGNLDQQQTNNYLLEKKELIKRYSLDYSLSLIKTNKIIEGIETRNYSYIKNLSSFLGLCTFIEIYNQTKNISNLIFSYSKNCSINREENNKIQKIFFDMSKNGTNENFYVIEIDFYEEGK